MVDDGIMIVLFAAGGVGDSIVYTMCVVTLFAGV
jgi:hypothetical protein